MQVRYQLRHSPDTHHVLAGSVSLRSAGATSQIESSTGSGGPRHSGCTPGHPACAPRHRPGFTRRADTVHRVLVLSSGACVALLPFRPAGRPRRVVAPTGGPMHLPKPRPVRARTLTSADGTSPGPWMSARAEVPLRVPSTGGQNWNGVMRLARCGAAPASQGRA
ncbi:hypothetical protein GCM10028784_01800 [Myceligenerans cantabricum]